MFDGLSHGPRFHPIYFWTYVFGMNSPWLVVPPILIYQSWKQLTLAQGLLDKETGFNPVKGGVSKKIRWVFKSENDVEDNVGFKAVETIGDFSK